MHQGSLAVPRRLLLPAALPLLRRLLVGGLAGGGWHVLLLLVGVLVDGERCLLLLPLLLLCQLSTVPLPVHLQQQRVLPCPQEPASRQAVLDVDWPWHCCCSLEDLTLHG